jgi:two-component system, NtrC family, response regulator AtoC
VRPSHDSFQDDLVSDVTAASGHVRTGTDNGAAGSAYKTTYASLLGHSARMRVVRDIVEKVAGTDATVLIRGESGVGKDIVARAVHAASPRHAGPFVKVNCAALPAELLESELFGHDKGAFTGAYRRKLGTFEFAHTGTIFLDEIGELPLALQPKLLHVLQDMKFNRVGGRELIEVDVRVVASTNRDLELALANGLLREDLFYRLNVVEIGVPALRERPEEVPVLARAFMARFNEQYGRDVELTAETVALLGEYPWPGNVRELENIIRRLVVLASAPQIHDELRTRLTALASRQNGRAPAFPLRAAAPAVELGLREIARRAALDAERQALREVLERVRWNRSAAARILQISYKTLLKKVAECGLGGEPPRRAS